MAFDAPDSAAARAPEDPARAAARRAAEKLDQHATAFIPDVSAWQFGILAAREALADFEDLHEALKYWRDQALDDVDRLNIIAEIDPDVDNPDHARFVQSWFTAIAPEHLDITMYKKSIVTAAVADYAAKLEQTPPAVGVVEDDALIDSLAAAAESTVADIVGALGISTSRTRDVDYQSMARAALLNAGLLESASW